MVIVDANIIVHSLINSAYSDKARQIFKTDIGIAAPDILAGEVANVLGKLVRTKLITKDQAGLFFDTLHNMPLHILDSDSITNKAFTLSLDYAHGYFDCIYLEVARLHSLPLLTLDEKMIKKFSTLGTTLIHLNDWKP
jgi:predicted nucleic acid-binding protein